MLIMKGNICSSTIIWNGEVNALAGYADDSMTTEIDGFTPNSEMFFFAQTEDGTIHQLSKYNENPPFSALWVNNGFAQILTLNIIDSIECGEVIEDTGCTDSAACNYDLSAIDDDGSCIFADDECEICFGPVPGDGTGVVVNNDADGDGVCDADEVAGCQDATACNYNENATDDDGSCILPVGCDTCSGETDGTGVVVNNDADGDGVCDIDEVFGCTDPLYEEYDPLATEDDGSCSVLSLDGCTDPTACNYNENATDDNGSCILPVGCDTCSGETDGTGVVVNNDADGDGICDADEVAGCQDATACNYNENATDDDGSCILPVGCDTCSGETDGTGTVINNDADGDGICDDDEIIEILGCTDESAFNFDELANTDDGSCCLISGCPDTTNILYNPEACFFDTNLCINIENQDDITIIPFATVNNVSCYNESDGSSRSD